MIWRKCFCLTLYFWPQWVLTLTFQVSQINFCLVDGFFIQKVYICEQAKIVFHWTKYLSNCLYFLSLTISAELGLCSHSGRYRTNGTWKWSSNGGDPLLFLPSKSLCASCGPDVYLKEAIPIKQHPGQCLWLREPPYTFEHLLKPQDASKVKKASKGEIRDAGEITPNVLIKSHNPPPGHCR